MKTRLGVGLLAWAFLPLSALAALRVMGAEYLFNADALYLPALFRDLFHEGGSLSSWQLTPAPYFFPDMLLYCALGLLVRRTSATILAFALAQTALFALALYAVARAVQPSGSPVARRGLLPLCALLASALLWASVTGHLEGLWLTLLSAIHFGTVLNALFSVALVLALLRGASGLRLWGLFLLAGAGAASDPLYLVVATAPLLALTLGAQGVERKSWRETVKLVASLLLGSGLGLWLALRMTSRRAALGYATLRLRAFQKEAHDLGQLWSLRLARQPASTVLWGAGIVVALVLVAQGVRRARAWRRPMEPSVLLAAYVLLAIVANYAAALLNATPDLLALVRYTQLALLLPFILLASVAAQPLSERARLTLAALGVPALAVLWGVALGWRPTPLDAVGDYRHPLASCLDAHRMELGAGRGVSDYWQAKPVDLLSQRGLTLVQLTDRNEPHLWINSERGYLDARDPRPYGFAVMRGLDRERFLRSYGPPDRRLTCGDAEIFVYGSGTGFDAHLRRDFQAALQR